MTDKRSQIQDVFFDGLISTYKHQMSPTIKALHKCMNSKAFTLEHKTIRLSLPRGLGNTRLAVMLMNFYPEATYLCHNKNNLIHVRKPLEGRQCLTMKDDPHGWSFKILVVDVPIQLQSNHIFDFESEFYFILG